jgi:hypothetical protein
MSTISTIRPAISRGSDAGRQARVYANWVPGTTDIAFDSTIEIEYYDYSTPGGRAETHNRKNDPRAAVLYRALLQDILPKDLRAPLPASFQPLPEIEEEGEE